MDFKQWFFQLKDERKDAPIDDDTGVVNVLTAGSPVEVTITDRFGTALSNPLTFSNGKVTFYTAKTVTSVDLSVLTANGDAQFLKGVTASEHRIDIDSEQRKQILVIPFAASDNTVVDTGFDLPAGMLVTDAYIKVVTTDSTETLDFGFKNAVEGGDLDGLLVGVSVGTAGHVTPYGTVTNGTNIDYLVVTAGYGALLLQSIAGADAVATNGGAARRYYLTDGTIKSLVYTGSSGSDTAAGYLILEYNKLV